MASGRLDGADGRLTAPRAESDHAVASAPHTPTLLDSTRTTSWACAGAATAAVASRKKRWRVSLRWWTTN